MPGEHIARVLAEQQDYYRARAGEYENWWLRKGRYDHGAEANERWFADQREAQAALGEFAPGGRILELACGTGLWTERLAPLADSVTALDGSEEALALAQAKVPATNVEWLQADIFEWEPAGAARYDVCFFGFWLSHVPLELTAAFWEKVARALAPGGRVFLIDSAPNESGSARDHVRPAPGEQLEARRLDDGREFRIVKHWLTAQALSDRVEPLGWQTDLRQNDYFVFGGASPRG